MPSVQRTTRAVVFVIAAGVVAAVILGLYLWVAASDWFLGDDFYFLQLVQQSWHWNKVFLPSPHRFWWTYRPIGMDTYYYLAFKLFGWNAQGFFGITVAVHMWTTGVVYRLARQLGFEMRGAVVAALLSASRFPAITSVSEACTFHYAAALFLHALALSLYIDFLQSRKRVFWVSSLFAFAAGILCNELVLNLPVLLIVAGLWAGGFRFSGTALLRALRPTWPFFATAGGFLVLRYHVLLEAPHPVLYSFNLGLRTAYNARAVMSFVTGGSTGLLLTLACTVLLTVALLPAKQVRRDALTRIARVWGLCLPWLLMLVLPLSVLPFPQVRFAIPVQAPAALLFAVFVDALWRVHGARFGRVLEIAMLVLVLLSIQWGDIRSRASSPRGLYMKALLETIEARVPQMPEKAIIQILYGGQGRADREMADQFKRDTFGGAAIPSRYPNKRISVRLLDVAEADPRRLLCGRCYLFDLLPSYQILPTDRKKLRLELKRRRRAAAP